MNTTTKIYAMRGDNRFVKYVGKTVKPLEVRLAQHLKSAREGDMSHRGCGIRKMLQVGKIPSITLLEVAVGNGDVEERAWIAYFRSYGIVLWNETDGGEGISNPSKETLEKRKATRKAKGTPYQTPASAAKISATLMGHDVPEHVRAKIRAKLQGHPPWNAGKDGPRLGMVNSKEHNLKIGLGNKGKVRTAAMRLATSERQKGSTRSPEQRAKIGAGLRLAYAEGRRQ